MPSYEAKDSIVEGRQLKVQRLSIPFVITGNATAASVVIGCDEPAVLFLKTEGVDQITEASGCLDDAAEETALNFNDAASDASGIFNLCVKIKEPIGRYIVSHVTSRLDGVSHPCYIGDTTESDGQSANGDKLLLTCNSTINFTSADLDADLEVEYVVSEDT